MGAEEKKLSHNPESGSSPKKRRTDFRLHCFPDITVEDPDSTRICAPLPDKFHRVQYDDESFSWDYIKSRNKKLRGGSYELRSVDG